MKSKQLLAFGVVAVFALSALGLILAEGSQAEPAEYDVDMGEFYSDTLQFVYSGQYAQNVYWDFGDGSEIVDEFNPRHTYTDYPAEYIVTQTATNTNSETGELQSSTERYRIYVHGPPVLTFVNTKAGAPAFEPLTVSYDTVATAPDYPEWAGHEFGGYYADAGCTTLFDWSIPVTSHANVYVKWNEGPGIIDPVPGDGETPSIPNSDILADSLAGVAGNLPLIMLAVTAVIGVMALATRRPGMIVLAVILVAITAYLFFGDAL